MLFNSWKYLIFLPVVFIACYFLAARYRWLFLLAASLFFYMLFSPYHIIVIGLMTAVSYVVAINIETAAERKGRYLVLGLVAIGFFLFVFKYFNFFMGNVSVITALWGLKLSSATYKIIIPVGISYITFQLMSYLIEVHRGTLKAERHFGIFALYVLFFPKVNSGPIERPQDMLHQFHEPVKIDPDLVAGGLKLMAWGFFKKVVIADRLAIVVNHVYGNLDSYSGILLIAAVVFFTFQLYCDFSGYTDIALGSAQVLGFRLTPNFDRPFLATSLTDFWRRWHITLSTWIRDYLYTPIAFNRRYWGKAGIVFALLTAFTLCGLWHGASWNYVIFGLLNGVGLAVEFLVMKRRARIEKKIPAPIANAVNVFITFSFFTFTLIFFRAATLADAWYVLTHLFANLGASVLPLNKANLGLGAFELSLALVAMAALMAVEYIERRGSMWDLISKKPFWLRWVMYYVILLSIALLGVYSSKAQFIYFQF